MPSALAAPQGRFAGCLPVDARAVHRLRKGPICPWRPAVVFWPRWPISLCIDVESGRASPADVSAQLEVRRGASASSESSADWLDFFSRLFRMRHDSQRSNNFDPK